MEKRSSESGRTHHSRLRRGSRDIVLAVLLTIAAATFITAAWLRGTVWSPTVPYETARQPSGN